MLSVLGQIVSEMRPLSKYKIETLNSDLNFSIPDDVPENMIYLPEYNKRVYSQNGEDGITMAIFDKIGFTNKKYLEFGATNECNNSQILHEKYGFSGILWNGSNTFCTYSNIFQEFINVENIKELCIKYNVPSEPDFVSIDIDGNDWHVWRELNKICRPRVLVIEYSGHFCPGNDNVMPYNANHVWDGSNYHGGSIEAMYILGRSIGYSLVCADNMGVNLFFIRDDIEPKKFFFGTNNVKMLYRLPKYGLPYRVGHPEDFLKRPWHSAKNLVYTFSETWFYGSELFHFLNQGFLKPIKILEIGSYEGCSAVHFSDNFLDCSESELVCVDPFDTRDTTSPVTENTKKLFTENIKKSKNGDKIHLREMYSSEFYKINNKTFDFIYIDGSHLVSDIQVDFLECLKILNDGGVLWMDDYIWGDGITIKNAIDKLYEDHKNQLKIIHKGYQIGFLKNPH